MEAAGFSLEAPNFVGGGFTKSMLIANQDAAKRIVEVTRCVPVLYGSRKSGVRGGGLYKMQFL
jgi:hypothetical protein